MTMEKEPFKYSTQIRVRNYEVDWQGIVHNANYLLYFEVGRVEYLKHLGVKVDLAAIKNESRVVLVRNEIDYRSPARFDDLIDVFTRISRIGRTSFQFDGMILDAQSGRLVAENVATHEWLSPESGVPIPVSEEFRRKISEFEGSLGV